MSSEKSSRLPFEPAKKNRPNTAKTKQSPLTKSEENQELPKATGVPPVVSQRMIRRMALFCGLPTAMGMLTFILSYFITSHHWLDVPHIVVVLVSMGFFGLGVLGLTYGLLSASWDEEIVGSKLGWNEFTTNWGRMTAAWQPKPGLKSQD